MHFRFCRRWLIPVVVLFAAIRCGGSDSFIPPDEFLPAHIVEMAGDSQAGVVGRPLPDTLVVRITDSRDRPVQSQKILFQLTAGGAGTLIPDTAITNSEGEARSVWVLGTIAGQQRVEARVIASGVAGGLKQVFTASAAAEVADTMFVVKGQGQQGLVSAVLTDSLVVLVGDKFGNPSSGQTVNWSVPAGQGSVSAATTTTGADGRAAVQRTLGPTAGAQTATAVWAQNPTQQVVFNSVAGAGGVSRLVKVFGDNQTAPAGQRLTDSIVVQAQDAGGNGVAGRDVVWVISGGGGTLSSGSTTTDAQGRTFVSWTLGTVAGANTATAAITGLPQVTFTATGNAAQPTKIVSLSSTTLSGPAAQAVSPAPSVKVTDNNNNGVQGVTVTFTVLTGNGTVSDGTGTGTSVTIATNTNGIATVNSWILGGAAGTNNNSLSATATGSGISGNPITFTASAVAGSAAKLAFLQQPSNAQAGVAIAPTITVQVQDLGGNPVPASTANVTVNLTTPNGAVLGGTKTVAAVGGVASFSTLTVDKASSGYTLTATGPGLLNGVSGSFNITAGVASKLGFVVQPANTGSGINITPPVQVAVQDLFGNTVTTAANPITVAIGTNPSAGTLTGTTTVSAVSGVASFSTLKIDKTGTGYTLTAAATSLTSATSTAFNVGAGLSAKLAFQQQPSNVEAGVPIIPAVTVLVQDAQGNTVPTATDSVFLALGNNPGGATLTGTRVAAVNGIATFGGITLDKTGTGYTLIASGPGLSSSPASSPFTVTPGTGQRLVFGVQPSSVAAGSSISPAVTVEMRDALNNVVNTFTGPITIGFNNNPTNATLGGTLTVNAVAGVSTFSNLTVNKVGSGYTLFASNPSASPTVSNGFAVTPGGAAAITFETQPPTSVPAVAGAAISPPITVQVRDAQGNAITTSTATVTMAIGANPGGSTLTGTTSVAAVGGVATFSNLILNKAANAYTLTASSAGLTGATSVVFNVRANDPSVLVFVQGPSNAQAGAVIAPPLTVRVNDAFGNLADFGGSVNMDFLNNAGGGTLSGAVSAGAVNGIATFSNLSINKSGTGYTLRATGAGVTGVTSGAFNITTAAASKLIITVQPTNANAGVAIAPAVVVQIRDPFDNIVSSTATVTMAITTNPGGATLTGGSVAAVGGVATFSGLSLNRTGVGYVLTATSGTLTAAISDPFTINPGAASVMVYTVQPGNSTAGSAITPAPQITVRDALGNTVTGFANAISMAIGTNPGGSTLTGITSVTPTNGVATFTNLALNRPGNGYTLVASTGGVPNATSGTFNVAAGSGNMLAFTVQPSNVVVGAAMTPAVVVAVQDAQGNTVTTANNAITLSLVANPGGAVLTGGTATAVNGVATFSNIRLDKAGLAYTMTATASGLVSAPPGVSFNVTAAASTTTVTADTPDPSVVGQAYTVSYTVTSAGGTPTGSVTVSDGAVTCTGILPATSCQLISITAGAKTLTATYGGDGNFSGSTSAGAAHTVNAAATTTAITSDNPDPSSVNSAYAVTYTVSVTAPGAGTPTGNVTVSDGTSNCVGTVAAGSCNLTSTTTGAKTLTATYSTDGNFAGSVSAGAPHTVSAAATVTTITADTPNPSVVGQVTAATFTVTGAPGTPTGNVTVTDGAVNCTATVAVGTCNLAFTTAGAKTLTATYAGDATHGGSTSAGMAHTVNAAATTTTITADTPDPSIVNTAYAVNFTVVANAPGAGTPTGNVTVGDGTNTCTATVAAGTCNLISTTTGAKNLVATYAGDGNFLTSTSAIAPHQVDPTSITVGITGGSPATTVVGQPYTTNFSVSGGTSTPTGNVTVSDGVQNCTGTLAGGVGSCPISFATAATKSLVASYAGDATHGTGTSPPASHVVNAAATSNSITSDNPDPSTVNTAYAVTYAVAVTAPGVGTPTGNVTVSDGAVTCVGTVAAGTCNLTSTTAGSKTLTATYATDGNFAGSVSAGAAHVVNPLATTTAVSSSANPSVFGQSITFTATVTSTGTPTGSVQFVVDGSNFGTPVTLTAGSATSQATTTLVAGNHTVVANFTGTGNFASSGGTLAGGQTVNAGGTATAVSTSGTPAAFGASVTFTATVTSGSGTPTGSVQFLVDAVNLGTPVALNGSGVATASTSALASGTHAVTANYTATGSFSNSSGTLSGGQVVSPAPTSTAVTSSLNPSTFGTSVTFTATVTDGAAGTPGGTVQFKDGATNLGAAVTLSGGVGTLITAALTVGGHSITAVYAGNTTFATSTSPTLTQTVNLAPTSTAVTSSLNPSTFGTSVTFTATVTDGAGGTPAGTVQFKDGGANLGSAATLNGSGVATFATSALSAGTHTITADYSGNAAFAISTGTLSGGQVVNAGGTATAVSTSGTPSAFGASVTFTATVTSGSGTPTGSVQFLVDAVNLGSPVALNGAGVATASTSALAPGTHTVTANYTATGSFSNSSGTLSGGQVVSPAPTSTAVTSSLNPSTFGQSVTFTATVTDGAAGTPTGTVQFKDGVTNLGSPVTLNGSGVATFATSALTVASHSITAVYAGNTTFAISTSPTLTQTVNLISTSTVVTAGTNPSVFGQGVTFTATVSGGATGGTVQFKVDNVALGVAVALSGGTATSPSISSLSVGNHAVTADYSGSGNFGPSSGTLSGGQDVNQANTTATITGHAPDPVTVNNPITIDVTVTSGGGTPTGSVTVSDGTDTCTIVALTSGAGSCQLTPTTSGGKTLVATYSGDTNFVSSISAGVAQGVDP